MLQEICDLRDFPYCSNVLRSGAAHLSPMCHQIIPRPVDLGDVEIDIVLSKRPIALHQIFYLTSRDYGNVEVLFPLCR